MSIVSSVMLLFSPKHHCAYKFSLTEHTVDSCSSKHAKNVMNSISYVKICFIFFVLLDSKLNIEGFELLFGQNKLLEVVIWALGTCLDHD